MHGFVTEMAFQKLEISLNGNVGVIRLKNPPVNALSAPLVSEFSTALGQLVADRNVRVIVVTGDGEKFFVAGADIKEFLGKNAIEGRQMVRGLQLVIHRIERSSKPVIAAINGYCLGGGLELAMACDVRYASENAKLGQPEINLGIIPGGGGTQRLPRLVGKGKAKELIYSGRQISAAEALAIQLVQRVTPPNELLPETMRLAQEIARKSSLIISYAKEAIDIAEDVSIDDGLIIEADKFGLCFGSEDKEEGVKAFLEKREAVFKGR